MAAGGESELGRELGGGSELERELGGESWYEALGEGAEGGGAEEGAGLDIVAGRLLEGGPDGGGG